MLVIWYYVDYSTLLIHELSVTKIKYDFFSNQSNPSNDILQPNNEVLLRDII